MPSGPRIKGVPSTPNSDRHPGLGAASTASLTLWCALPFSPPHTHTPQIVVDQRGNPVRLITQAWDQSELEHAVYDLLVAGEKEYEALLQV